MFVRAHSKQRFGEPKEPYINVYHIVSAELGHEAGMINVKMSNGEEMTVTGKWAQLLLAHLEQNQLQ